jgi:hypothetical protein
LPITPFALWEFEGAGLLFMVQADSETIAMVATAKVRNDYLIHNLNLPQPFWSSDFYGTRNGRHLYKIQPVLHLLIAGHFLQLV